MARIRMIKPEFFDDPDLADVSAMARLFFIGLWTQADKAGRLVDDPRRLKARIFPYDTVNVGALAVELHGKDMIRRYHGDDGQSYIWIRSFLKHQRPHPKEPESLIPPCPKGAGKRNVEPCKETAGTPESGSLDLDSGIRNLDSGTRKLEVAAQVAPTPRAKPARATATNADFSPDGFSAFWSAYPRRTGKGAAVKAFARLKPSGAVLEAMLAALQWQVRQPEWTKDGGQFIPHAATWLNQRRWEDEPFEPLPVDPRQLPPGRLTAAQYTIRAGRETLDVLNELERREAAERKALSS